MPSASEKRNNFIAKRLIAFIIRDCGTGAGGFKAGNACAKGGGEGDSKGNGEGKKTFEKKEPIPDGAASETVSRHRDMRNASLQKIPLNTEARQKLLQQSERMHQAEQDYISALNGNPKNKEPFPVEEAARECWRAHERWDEMTTALMDKEKLVQFKKNSFEDLKTALADKNIKVSKKDEKEMLNRLSISEMEKIKVALVQREAVCELGCQPIKLRFDDVRYAEDAALAYYSPTTKSITVIKTDEGLNRTMFHEMAHAQHHSSNKNQFGLGGLDSQINTEEALKSWIKNTPTTHRAYGLTNPHEFVAVAWERIRLGDKMTVAEWKMYDRCKGPKIRPSARKAMTK